MKDNKYYVYLHIKLNGEPFYVGKGFDRRAYQKTSRSTWWHNTVKKHGLDIIILEENLLEEKAIEQEIYWIKRIGRINKKEGTLINLTDGGDGTSGHTRSEKSKKKQGETRKINNFKPSKYSLEKAAEGKRNNGLIIREITTCVEFKLIESELYFDIPKTTIRQNCNTGHPLKLKKHKGFNFVIVKNNGKKSEYNPNPQLPPTKRNITSSAIILDKETGIFWEGIKEASEAYDINYYTLEAQLRGRYKNKTNLIKV